MATRKKTIPERRTRVTCHLPLNNAREEKAFFKIVAYINELRHAKVGVSGFTHSELRPAVFHGYWWPNEDGEALHDQLVLCTLDFHLPSKSKQLTAKVKELKQTIEKWYRHYRSSQQDVWVVAHPILRQE